VATIRPFAAIRYVPSPKLKLSDVIAPPYDVLDEAQKAALQAKHPNNIVTVDLPWLPPKTVGPDWTYESAAGTLRGWLGSGVLKRDTRAAMYPYTQTFTLGGRTYHRRGFIALVKLSPFGQGQVIPHEQTYASAIEDRLKLMRATGVQLSPIFGLFNDTRGEVTRMLYENAGRPELDGTLDDVRHQVWSVIDAEVENKIISAMGTKPIYIADGHHRYTTALQYQKEMEQANGGHPLPPNDPANFVMFVLVGIQNDGLIVLPTHRLIGNVEAFNIGAFRAAVADTYEVAETILPADQVEKYVDEVLPKTPPHTFGLYDGRTKSLYQLTPRIADRDILETLEPNRSPAWRRLDVAILQRYLLDQILQPKFGGGKEITRGYTAYAHEVPKVTDGSRYQIALLLKATPIHALEELGKTGEVMPPKSTFFFPKLATGLTINPLR
jgi:uncharacterized protein (DUF1015 family)